MANYCATINYKNKNFRVILGKILMAFFFYIHDPPFLGYFTPRVFSLIEVMELVYFGGYEVLL